MNKHGLLTKMIKESEKNLSHDNNQISSLQFMYNQLESIRESVQQNTYDKNEGMFSFTTNVISNTQASIVTTGKYVIKTDSGTFILDKSSLLAEIDFTLKAIKTLLKRQKTIQAISTLPNKVKKTKIREMLREDSKEYKHPSLLTDLNVKVLAKGRYLLTAHMSKPHAFDSNTPLNKGLNRFVHIFFLNVKKQQALDVKDTTSIAEYIGVLSN